MTRHPKLWLIGTSIFTLINVAGAPFAFVGGEPLHGAAHVVLAAAGAYLMSRMAPRARRRQQLVGARGPEQQLDRLQQSLDTIAIEVERVGEAQRFMTKIAEERARQRSDE
jgi:hypothetical protein